MIRAGAFAFSSPCTQRSTDVGRFPTSTQRFARLAHSLRCFVRAVTRLCWSRASGASCVNMKCCSRWPLRRSTVAPGSALCSRLMRLLVSAAHAVERKLDEARCGEMWFRAAALLGLRSSARCQRAVIDETEPPPTHMARLTRYRKGGSMRENARCCTAHRCL